MSDDEKVRPSPQSIPDARRVTMIPATRVGDAPKVYEHPKSLASFEELYRREYENELADCDRWIAWCKEQKDDYGWNFFQGKRGATVFNNIKMGQVLRILKREYPNV